MALALIAPLLLVACSKFPFFRQEEGDSTGTAGRAAREDDLGETASHEQVEVLLQNIRYDGEALEGRLLISPLHRSLRLDQRLIESAYLTTESVSNCATGAPLAFIVMDVYAKPPSDEDLLLLKPGYWYGKDLRIPLFAKTETEHPRPECIEVEFAFRDLRGNTLTLVRARAGRSPHDPTGRHEPADAGMTVDAGTPTDAGPRPK